ncbi:IS630 transposase-related protein [Streptococcus merionis]|uniref:IS630 transposase-related protein n=1 Tax=Streptococcus merionis TaxID=400065 RepID=UPI003513EA67
MTYSIDFRQRVIAFVNEGHTRTEACDLFGINPSTLRKWEKMLKVQGHLVDKTRQCPPRKLPKDELLAYVEQHPDAYLREIAEHFSCAINAVWKALRKYDITLKKDNHLSRTRSSKS